MALTKREQRVITAFINCVKHGEYSEDYAILLIEDDQRYGWLSNAAKDAFYEGLDALHPAEPEPADDTEPADDNEPAETDEPAENTEPEE